MHVYIYIYIYIYTYIITLVTITKDGRAMHEHYLFFESEGDPSKDPVSLSSSAGEPNPKRTRPALRHRWDRQIARHLCTLFVLALSGDLPY